jgi:hypothetical protein
VVTIRMNVEYMTMRATMDQRLSPKIVKKIGAKTSDGAVRKAFT